MFVGAKNYRGDDAFLRDLYSDHTIALEELALDQFIGSYDDADWFDRAIWDEIEAKHLLFPAFGRLDQLHLRLPECVQALDETQINGFSAAFYETGEKFKERYREFVADVVQTLGAGPCYYQEVPTIRFHFPNQSGFGERMSWHSDIMLGHPPHEVNVWVPVTNSVDGNSIRIMHRAESLDLMESCEYDFTQFNERFDMECMAKSKPVVLGKGHYLLFDPRCIHATQENKTTATRVSIDFRVMPLRAFHLMRRQYVGGGRKPCPFAPGGYYAEDVI